MMRPEIPTQRPTCVVCGFPCSAAVYTITRTPARNDDGPTRICSTRCGLEWFDADEWAESEGYWRRIREGRDELARLRGQR